ncbi:MAG TPA: hypothetical protein VHV77_08845 [Pirellulales bacterium]|jgi:hypothetical protein|nr:hypothetical protein [Pirellulales bacterium]
MTRSRQTSSIALALLLAMMRVAAAQPTSPTLSGSDSAPTPPTTTGSATQPSPTPANASMVAMGSSGSGSDSPVASAETWVESYTMPDAPALTLIGADTSKIQDAGPLLQFGAALLNTITPQGGIQSGVAIEATGKGLFNLGKDWTKYRSSYLERFFARMSISIGTTQETSGSTMMSTGTPMEETTLGSIGLRLVFIDGTDPLTDPAYSQHVLDAEAKCPLSQAIADPAAHAACLKTLPQLTAPAWNATTLIFAAATSGAFADGKLSQGQLYETASWLTFGLGVGANGQISLVGEYMRSHFSSQNVGAMGARFKYGGNSIRGYIEASYATAKPDDVDNRRGSAMLGLDIKITDGTWLNASVGGDYDLSGSPFSVFSLASFKYAFASKPDITTN